MESPPPEAEEKKVPVEFCKRINGLDSIILRGHRSSSVEVLLYGAQVISWKNQDDDELLFVSSKANFNPPTPIFGGIPICFPDVSDHGLDPHQFARYRYWNIDCSPPPLQCTSLSDKYVDLIFTPNDTDLYIWPHRFEYRLRITLGALGELIMTSRIKNTNTNGKPFWFSFAYRNHLRVSNICDVSIEGLKTINYLDNLKSMNIYTEKGDAVTFTSEVNKEYIDAPTNIAVIDHQKNQTISIHKDSLRDFGVWNPWKKKAKQMGEIGKNEYSKMVCVGPCVVYQPICLRPGEEWKGEQELSFESNGSD